MAEKVYFIKSDKDDLSLCKKLEEHLTAYGHLDLIEERDMVAVKTHFGEVKELGYVRPLYFKMLGRLLKKIKSQPFLTETSTLYKGNRSNGVIHLEHAFRQGFTYENTGLPILMADGLFGDEEIEVPIPGKLYRSVNIASLIVKAQALITVSHFTGHIGTGFGAALKNLGMGCSSRRGKMMQHSTTKPSIKKSKCTRCGVCVKWCPAEAITMEEKSAVINKALCIGCGQCLAMCRFDAVAYNWGASYEDLQKKVVEHAMGVAETKKGKALYINFLTRISKDCDCMPGYSELIPDIGVLVSRDPVAVDAASIDLFEKSAGKKLSDMAYNIPYRIQISYAKEIGFGSPDYELITV
ncbi:MAG TPA: DUF362 domain-containing protein [Spirochaetota bacterium]|nr:DUF362 domain-containing protein [Spirochaetota bacterium]HPI90839.1 DUF362 domain-containing protein [Spirochaetota bacterium]HPR49866.1 DUF362 domain-containing protein [Spirochaetota bacterium]